MGDSYKMWADMFLRHEKQAWFLKVLISEIFTSRTSWRLLRVLKTTLYIRFGGGVGVQGEFLGGGDKKWNFPI